MVRIEGVNLIGVVNGITINSGSYPVKTTGKSRTGVWLDKVTSITVHNTGNTSKGAGARNHHAYLHNNENSGRTFIGYHFAVDGKYIYQCLPIDEVSYHCGTQGNYNSISIEICENVDMDYNKAEENAIALIKELLRLFNITEIKSHKDWSGKNCPHKILPRWNEFLEKCKGGGDTNVKKLYRVQVGAFEVKENALRLQRELGKQGYSSFIAETKN